MNPNKELTEYVKNILKIDSNSSLNTVEAIKGFTFNIPVFSNSLRWNSRYEFYRNNLDVDISFSDSGYSKYSYENDDFTKFMNGGGVIRKTKILNTHSQKINNLKRETNEKTGTFKKVIPLMREYVPAVFKELILNTNNDISKFNWNKFDYTSVEKELEEFYKYTKTFYENNSDSDEYNDIISERNNLLEQEIESKIKPRGQFQDLNYGYEIINEKKEIIDFNYSIAELIYNESIYYLLIDNINSFYKLNKPLKEERKSIFSSLFKFK